MSATKRHKIRRGRAAAKRSRLCPNTWRGKCMPKLARPAAPRITTYEDLTKTDVPNA